MGFFNSCWDALIQIASYAHSMEMDHEMSQYPLSLPHKNGDQQPITGGPTFTPQNASIQCQYPSLQGFEYCGSESDRTCWLKGPNGKTFDINTDYENEFPVGIPREYWLNITVDAIAPDGYLKPLGQIFNSTYPGPVIEACWGDELIVHLTNKIDNLGTTIHWHGIRQRGTNDADGVNGVTQCPVAKDESFTYKFRVEQYGHSWYHSHYQTQYSDGAMAGLTLYGPTSAPYDEAWDPVLMNDWVHINTSIAFKQELTGGVPVLDSLLLDGQGTFTCSDQDPLCCTSCINATAALAPPFVPKCAPGVSPEFCCNPDESCLIRNSIGEVTGQKAASTFTRVFKKGKRYLLRLVNSSAVSMFQFSIDGHDLEIVATDLVPVQPYTTDSIFIGIGQRYQVIVTAKDLDNGDFWIRTRVATGCGSVQQDNEQTGVVHYNASSTATPRTAPNNFNFACVDEDPAHLRPMFPWNVTKIVNDINGYTFEAGIDSHVNQKAFRWDLTDFPLFLDYSNPTILNTQNNTYLDIPNNAVWRYNFTDPNDFVYLVITGANITSDKRKIPAAHPIHLHGHDFVILEQVDAPFNGSTINPQTINPTRRDVALLYPGGYLVLAFRPDNPGVWLVHCHIAFHASSGLALQILERQEEIPGAISPSAMTQEQQNCQAWDHFDLQFSQDDSGI